MDNYQLKRPFEILLVEDNDADVDIIKRFMKEEIEFSYNLSIIKDGEAAAKKYQNDTFDKQTSMVPDLIILDLNLPQIDGLELLTIFKTNQSLNKTPVVVFTTSNNPNDIRAAYAHHANSYIVKPFDIKQYKYIINVIKQYWLQTVMLPTVM